MSTIALTLGLLSIICGSAAYADNFHIENNSNTGFVAAVYFNGKLETTLTLQPGQEYVHSFWHNLSVNVVLSNPKTKQTCSLEMQERKYEWSTIRQNYQPKVIQHGHDCPYISSFDQANWQSFSKLGPKFSTVYVWAPWF